MCKYKNDKYGGIFDFDRNGKTSFEEEVLGLNIIMNHVKNNDSFANHDNDLFANDDDDLFANDDNDLF